MKKALIFCILYTFLLQISVSIVYADNEINIRIESFKIYVNDNECHNLLVGEIISQEGSTYLSESALNKIFEGEGLEFAITSEKLAISCSQYIASNLSLECPKLDCSETVELFINSQKTDVQIPHICYMNKNYIQLRGLASILNYKIDWIDYSQKIIISKKFNIKENLYLFRNQDGKYGYMDAEGNIKINPIYYYARPFSDGLAIVRKGMYYGYIDTNGSMVIPCEYKSGSDFQNGVACVNLMDDSKNPTRYITDVPAQRIYINKNNVNIFDKVYHESNNFQEGYAASVKRGYIGPGINNAKWSFISKTGDWATDKEFDSVDDFLDGYAVTYTNKKYEIINTQFENVFNFDEKVDNVCNIGGGYFILKINNKYSVFDLNKLTTFGEYTLLFSSKNDDLILARDNDSKWGFISRKGETILPFIYKDAKTFCEGVASVTFEDGSNTIINRQGEMLTPPSFTELYDNSQNGLIQILDPKEFTHIGYMTHKGERITLPSY